MIKWIRYVRYNQQVLISSDCQKLLIVESNPIFLKISNKILGILLTLEVVLGFGFVILMYTNNFWGTFSDLSLIVLLELVVRTKITDSKTPENEFLIASVHRVMETLIFLGLTLSAFLANQPVLIIGMLLGTLILGFTITYVNAKLATFKMEPAFHNFMEYSGRLIAVYLLFVYFGIVSLLGMNIPNFYSLFWILFTTVLISLFIHLYKANSLIILNQNFKQ